MPIPTEPVGSIPRPLELVEAVRSFAEGRISQAEMDAFYKAALHDAIDRLEATRRLDPEVKSITVSGLSGNGRRLEVSQAWVNCSCRSRTRLTGYCGRSRRL